MGRRESRDAAVKLIYQLGFTEDESNIDDVITTYISNAKYFEENDIEKKNDLNYIEDLDYAYLKNVLEGVKREEKAIDEMIDKHAKGWSIQRMARIDVAVLRVAVYELTRRPDIPNSVVINEAVELAKKYSHGDAGAFINGILASVITDIKEGKQGDNG